MAATAYRRIQPLPSYHSPHYNGSTTTTLTQSNAPRRSTGMGAARLPFAQANGASSSYKVEIDNRNGQEVIVIDSSPEPEDEQPVGKRRKHENGTTSYNSNGYIAPPPSNSYPTKVSSGTGQKRKHQELQPTNHNREHYAPSASVKTAKTVKAKSPPILPCDDKEGHFIPRTGETLGNGRYRILSLLGQGTFGKVVKCTDTERPQQLVAVKVIRAVQKYRDASKVEIRVLKRLRERDPHNIHNCIHMLECFDDRNHICIVTELLSVSVFDFLKDNEYAPFPEAHIQKFAKQLLDSVAFLHDLQLVHTDLKPENILLVDDTAYQIKKPGSNTKTQRVLRSADIRLIDFGSATFEEDYHASVVSTRHYRAPEIILGMGWSYPCDAWSIGCILVELYTGEALFQTHENVEHLAMMERVFSMMPEAFAKRAARNKPEWFKGVKLDYPTPSTSRQSRKFVKQVKQLEEIISQKSIFGARFARLVGGLLKWDPAKRTTVREALKDSFFQLQLNENFQ